MNASARVEAIYRATTLDAAVTGYPAFNLHQLTLPRSPQVDLPDNLRLGHLAERVVAQLIEASSNYKLLYENVQLRQANRTIGEIDFIIEEESTQQKIHLEVGYKFYLYDSSIPGHEVDQWIGPNRNDTLARKLTKLRGHQFPLLRLPLADEALDGVDTSRVEQRLCLMANLFVPLDFDGRLSPLYHKAVQGYYLSLDRFLRLHNDSKTYHLPEKTAWGIDPKNNKHWQDLTDVEAALRNSIEEHRSVLVWEKSGVRYSAFFVVWW